MLNLWSNTFNAAKSDGTLPLKRPARAMRYRKAIIWTVDVSRIGANAQKGKGSWTVEFFLPNGVTSIFKQTVTMEILLISQGSGAFSLFTWSYTRDEFNTSNVSGIPTDKTNIGRFLLGGTALSEQGLLLPGGGSDSTNEIATIIADWYSPVYVFQAPAQKVPVGARVKVSKDTWGFGPASVEYGWAFDEAAASPVGTLTDGLGSLIVGCAGEGIGREGSGRVHIARSWPLDEFRHLERLCPIKGDYPSFQEQSDGRLIACVLGVEGVLEYQSQTSGLTWERMLYAAPDAAQPAPGIVFGPSVSMPQSLRIDDDTRLHVALDNTILVWNLVNGAGIGTRGIIGKWPDSDTSVPCLEQTRDGRFLIIGGQGRPVYEAKSLPPSWEKLPVGGAP